MFCCLYLRWQVFPSHPTHCHSGDHQRLLEVRSLQTDCRLWHQESQLHFVLYFLFVNSLACLGCIGGLPCLIACSLTAAVWLCIVCTLTCFLPMADLSHMAQHGGTGTTCRNPVSCWRGRSFYGSIRPFFLCDFWEIEKRCEVHVFAIELVRVVCEVLPENENL